MLGAAAVFLITSCTAVAAAAGTPDVSAPRHSPGVDRRGHPCPADWAAACPGEPCTPLTTPYPKREVMAWHAGSFGGCDGACSANSWTHYNYSVVTTVVIYTGKRSPCGR